FFFSSRRRPTRFSRDWSSDVCSSDLFKCGFKANECLRRCGCTRSPFRLFWGTNRGDPYTSAPSGKRKVWFGHDLQRRWWCKCIDYKKRELCWINLELRSESLKKLKTATTSILVLVFPR